MTWQELWDKVVGWVTSETVINSVVRLLIALVVMFITFKIINLITRRIEKRAGKKHADKTVFKTLAYILRLGLKVAITICLVGFVGIDTSGLTALVASFGVCIGLAVNGALSNVAGGVLIIVTRPFRIDDYIIAQGYEGTVVDIHLTNTKLITPDNKVIYVPNGALANGNIVNVSEKDTRRVDIDFSISYANDFEKAKAIVLDVIEKHELILKDPAPFVRVGEHADSAIKIKSRSWVNSGDYWAVYFDLIEQVKTAFDQNGIEIPFNQIDVNIKTQDK